MRRGFAVVLTTITIQHMHCTQTDYLFMVTACICPGQTQTGGQRESSNCQATCIGVTSSRKWWFQQPHSLTSFTDEQSNWLGLFHVQHILFCRFLTITIDQLEQKQTTIKWLSACPYICHFNLTTFTWYVGRSAKVDITVCQGNLLSWKQICHVNVSRWGYLPSWGQIRNTSNSGKNHLGGGFASLLKVTIESNSTEGCSNNSKWVYRSINRQTHGLPEFFLLHAYQPFNNLEKVHPRMAGL